MADETPTDDPVEAATEIEATEAVVTPEPESPPPAADGPTATAEETAAAEPVEEAAPVQEPQPAPATKAKAKAKPAASAGKPGKPAGANAPKAEQAKPGRPGLRGRVKTRGRGGKAPAGDRELPVVRAQAKYVRTSARKARLVCDHIRGKSVAEAQAILAFAPRAVAADWAKLLKSAVANAENNHELLGEDLRVKEAFADEGPTLKRFRPRAMGRATPIRKRTSHLTITLTPKE
jgi:ribosomal protein L22